VTAASCHRMLLEGECLSVSAGSQADIACG